MGTTRFLPRTMSARKRAIDAAFTKKNNAGPAGNFLTQPTTDRLDAAHQFYVQSTVAITHARYMLHNATPAKTAALREAQLYGRHFITSFNMGVARGKYTAAQRAFFGIEVASERAPTMNSESSVLRWCNNIVSGNAQRVLLGGAAMCNPTIEELEEKYNTFRTLHSDYSNLKDALDIEQEKIAARTKEIDGVIKKVWGEVENFYSEEAKESQRANAREWGVVYIHTGTEKAIIIKIKMADGSTALPPNTLVSLQDEEEHPNKNNEATYLTLMQGELPLHVTGHGLVPHHSIISVLPDGDQRFEVVMVKEVEEVGEG